MSKAGPSLMDLYRMYLNDEVVKYTKTNIMYEVEYERIHMLVFMSIQHGIELYIDKDKNDWMKKVDLKKMFHLKQGQTLHRLSWKDIPVEISVNEIGMSFTKSEDECFLDKLEDIECRDGYELYKVVSEIVADLNKDLFDAMQEIEIV